MLKAYSGLQAIPYIYERSAKKFFRMLQEHQGINILCT